MKRDEIIAKNIFQLIERNLDLFPNDPQELMYYLLKDNKNAFLLVLLKMKIPRRETDKFLFISRPGIISPGIDREGGSSISFNF